MLLALLAVRIPNPIGEVLYLPHISSENVTDFIGGDKVAILLLTANTSDYSFCNLGISMYRSGIRFAVGDAAVAKTLSIDTFPCYVAYHKGKFFALEDVRDAVEFACFCQRMVIKITNTAILFQAEQLRRVLAGNETVLIGVDSKQPPAEFKNDIPFYGVQSRVVREFGLPTASGYYVYRPTDRQFIRISRSYRQYLSTPLVPFRSVDFTQHEFAVALFVNLEEKNVTVAGRDVDVLHAIARKFDKQAFFSIVSEKQPFEAEFGIEYIERPFVLVWKNKIDSNRWIWKGEDGMEDFVSGVLAGEIEKAPLVKTSMEPNECNLHDFRQKTGKGDVFLFVYSEGNAEVEMRKMVVASVREILPSVTFLEFDAGRNELPQGLHLNGTLPIIVVLKDGQIDHQFEFRRDTTVGNLVDIVIERSAAGLEKPELDYEDLQRNISRQFPASFDIPTFDFNFL